MLFLEGLVGLHRTVQFKLLQHYWLGIDYPLDYHDIEWFALETNILSFLRLHPSTAFQTPLLTMRATPISFKGFLPTVVDTMVI